MLPIRAHGNLLPLEVARAMSKAKTPEGGHWIELMASVAQKRDRDSFMRIYDHFAPRVRL
jgi:hypothetical protein